MLEEFIINLYDAVENYCIKPSPMVILEIFHGTMILLLITITLESIHDPDTCFEHLNPPFSADGRDVLPTSSTSGELVFAPMIRCLKASLLTFGHWVQYSDVNDTSNPIQRGHIEAAAKIIPTDDPMAIPIFQHISVFFGVVSGIRYTRYEE